MAVQAMGIIEGSTPRNMYKEVPQNVTELSSSNSHLSVRWERCLQCSFWAKYCLFTINFLVWIGGICLLAIGIWARTEKGQLGALDHLTIDPAVFFIVIGFVMFIISIFGCIGSIRENICLLKMFCIVIAIVFVVEIVIGILVFVFVGYVQESMVDYMKNAIKIYQDNADYQDAVDYIQRRFQCCGATSYNDWERNIYYNCSSIARSRCGVPISCCKDRTNVQCGFQTRIAGEGYAFHHINTRPCIAEVMVLFKDNLIIIGLIAFIVGFVELMAIILAHILIKHILVAQKELREASHLQTDMPNYETVTTMHLEH